MFYQTIFQCYLLVLSLNPKWKGSAKTPQLTRHAHTNICTLLQDCTQHATNSDTDAWICILVRWQGHTHASRVGAASMPRTNNEAHMWNFLRCCQKQKPRRAYALPKQHLVNLNTISHKCQHIHRIYKILGHLTVPWTVPQFCVANKHFSTFSGLYKKICSTLSWIK